MSATQHVFTAIEKLKAVERELGYRRRLFARRVAEGKLTQEEVDYEIALMEAIVRDYCEMAERERAVQRGNLVCAGHVDAVRSRAP